MAGGQERQAGESSAGAIAIEARDECSLFYFVFRNYFPFPPQHSPSPATKLKSELLWLVLGGLMVLIKRGILKGIAAWAVIVVLGLSAAFLARNKLYSPAEPVTPAVEAAAVIAE